MLHVQAFVFLLQILLQDNGVRIENMHYVVYRVAQNNGTAYFWYLL